MNQDNNFNNQGYDRGSNNQINGYDPQTGKTIYEVNNTNHSGVNTGNMNQQDNATSSNNNGQLTQIKPKKLLWWIPVLLLIAGVVLWILKLVIDLLSYSSSSELGYGIGSDPIKNPISTLLSYLTLICWLLIVPSVIFVIVKYNTKTADEKKLFNMQMRNSINNASTLDEKLLIAYIGDNYNKILTNKFNISAWFFNIFYFAYRKLYIIALVVSVISNIMMKISSLALILEFIFVVASGLLFNKYYVIYAKKQIERIKSENSNVTEEQLIQLCSQKGGTSVLSIVIFMIAWEFIVTILNTIFPI